MLTIVYLDVSINYKIMCNTAKQQLISGIVDAYNKENLLVVLKTFRLRINH